MKKVFFALLLIAGGCGGDAGRGELFTPKPECMGEAIVPYAGTFPQVISDLSIGSVEDGFDLDGDGKPDNKLAAVSSLSLSATSGQMQNNAITFPLLHFDYLTGINHNASTFDI